MRKEKKIRYETKTINVKQTVTRKEKKKNIRVVMKKEMQDRPRMILVKKFRNVKKYVYKPKTYRKKVVKMVKTTRMVNKVKYVNKQIKRRGTRMVKQINTISKRVPKNIPVPLAALISHMAYEQCACYQKKCACYGEIDCPCCYPSCACAPSMLSPTEQEMIERTEEVQVP